DISGSNVCHADRQGCVRSLCHIQGRAFLPDHIPENDFEIRRRDKPNLWMRRCDGCLLSELYGWRPATPEPVSPLSNQTRPADAVWRYAGLHRYRCCPAPQEM